MEVDAQRDLKYNITVLLEDGSIIVQKVVYDWKPLICEECSTFGHAKSQCPKVPKVKQVWRVKDKNPVPNIEVEG